jgi:Ni,Fe-hydrogenase III small subunit
MKQFQIPINTDEVATV